MVGSTFFVFFPLVDGIDFESLCGDVLWMASISIHFVAMSCGWYRFRITLSRCLVDGIDFESLCGDVFKH
jgi:hypothetical protein